MESQITVVLLKPDAIRRGLQFKIESLLQAVGLGPPAHRSFFEQVDEELIAKHYEEHKARANFLDLIGFMRSGPMVALAIKAPNAIPRTREFAGESFDPERCGTHTIRFMLRMSEDERQAYEAANGPPKVVENLIHTSDGQAAAEREFLLWFPVEAKAWFSKLEQEQMQALLMSGHG